MAATPRGTASVSHSSNAIRYGIAALGKLLHKASPSEWVAATLLLLTCFSLFISSLLAYMILHETVHSLCV